MKCLEIKNGKGYYKKVDEMVEIDKLNKDDLLNLLNSADVDVFEMDNYDETLLANKAHQIIYEAIHSKLSAFLSEKDQFDKQVDALYIDAIGEYAADILNESKISDELEKDEGDTINPEDIPF